MLHMTGTGTGHWNFYHTGCIRLDDDSTRRAQAFRPPAYVGEDIAWMPMCTVDLSLKPVSEVSLRYGMHVCYMQDTIIPIPSNPRAYIPSRITLRLCISVRHASPRKEANIFGDPIY